MKLLPPDLGMMFTWIPPVSASAEWALIPRVISWVAPSANPLNVEDWATTIYKCLGIVVDKELMAPGDRPIEIVKGGKLVKGLLA